MPSLIYMLAGAMLLGSAVAGAAPTPALAPTQAVTIRFAPQLASKALACGDSYDAQGMNQSTVVFGDLRFFVSSLELLDEKMNATLVTLDQDGRWQYQDIALLDFENGKAACRNGTPAMHGEVTGKVPAGQYRGLRFTLGLPASLNHADATMAAAPLNQSAMFWSWQAGYRFMKLELDVVNQQGKAGFPIHIGSSACQAASMREPATTCRYPNRVVVTLDRFDATSDRVLFDLSALIAHTRLDLQTPGTAPGCMSAADDPDCAGVFDALGLGAAGVQQVFGVARQP